MVAQGYFKTLRAQKLEVVAERKDKDFKDHLELAQGPI